MSKNQIQLNSELILDQFPLATVIFDKNLIVRFINKEFIKYLKKIGVKTSKEKKIGTNALDLLRRKDITRWEKIFDQILKGEKHLISEEIFYKKADGSSFITRISLLPYIDSEEQIQGGILLGEDITQEKKILQNLESSEDRYKKLVREAMVGICLLSEEGEILFANPMIEIITGYTLEELKNINFIKDIVAKDDQSQILSSLQSNIRDGTALAHFRYHIIYKNGKSRTVESAFCRVKHQGEYVVQGVIHDVTKQVQSEKKLQEQLNKITVLNQISHSISTTLNLEELYNILYEQIKLVIPTDAFFIALNDEGKSDFNIVFSVDVINGSPVVFDKQDIPQKMSQPVLKIIESKEPLLILRDKNFQKFDGTERFGDISRQSASIMFVPILIKENPIGLISCQNYEFNIYNQSHLDLLQNIANQAGLAINNAMLYQEVQSTLEILQSTRDQLIQSQKMESIGALAGGIAHDFNNILGGILGYTSFIKTMITQDDKIYPYVDIIEKSGERANILTQQLLGFVRVGKYNVSMLNINSVIEETVHLLEKSLDKKIIIETRLEKIPYLVEGDSGQLQQVFTNIAVNARDAMPSGGHLIFETSNLTIDKKTAKEIVGAHEGDYTMISISDTGQGIPEAVKNRIFDPFFTTKEKGKGTGLGLSIAYTIVKSHDGIIYASSKVGLGTTFKIYLPAKRKREGIKEPFISYSESLEDIRGGSETILLADDEEIIRQLWKNILENKGYSILLAKNGKEAVDIFKKSPDKIDLVVLDIIMPELDGKETFTIIKKLRPDIKVIISSGFSKESAAGKMIKGGAKAFIQKPSRVPLLLKTVRDVLDEE